jgi:hypothetical protein
MTTNLHRITLEGIKGRAYTAMYNSERKYGSWSGPHTLAWKVFCEASELLDENSTAPRAFVSDDEIRGALALVESLCQRRCERTLTMVATLAERRHFRVAA